MEVVQGGQTERAATQTKAARVPMERNQLGMLAFLGSEVVFFGLLIMAYVYYRLSDNREPNAHTVLETGTTAFFTFFLLSSSITIWLADRSLARQKHKSMILWLVVTVALGAVFLVGQGLEYARLIGDSITVGRNTFGTTFFTMTGFHGFHVFVGLTAIAIIAGMAAFLGDFKGPHSVALNCISLYWHFVDVVWIVIFTLVYIIQ